MKTITITILSAFMFIGTIFSQTYSTGTIVLSTTPGLEYSAKIDISTSEVTLTLIGPADRYLALGFGVDSMTEENDVVMYLNGTTLSDRTFDGVGDPPLLDSSQDWSTVSNTVASGVRTIVSTRALNTGEAFDYVFNTSQTTIDLVWARANSASFALNYHGGSNRGITTAGITLGVEDFLTENVFRIFPNPSDDRINISLRSGIVGNVKLSVHDLLGNSIIEREVLGTNISIPVADWHSGLYVIKVSNETSTQTKKFIKI